MTRFTAVLAMGLALSGGMGGGADVHVLQAQPQLPPPAYLVGFGRFDPWWWVRRGARRNQRERRRDRRRSGK